ncbi:Uncharacterised protein [Nocardia otitidiscaviarum]|uniref:Dihydrofolate reductase n=1 Tax=Nocardia otitidiscaviarum TaxID=1823 RepID=A0A378Y9F2_9NOCA|nr:Uncharacterised protein [Nocardia otitidiscaviarum]
MEDGVGNPIRLYMSMSVDGYIAGPDDRPGQELGRGGGRLFNWRDDRNSEGPSGEVYREAMATGAVISGRRTFELARRWQGDHHDGVPIFVLTHRVDDGDAPPGPARGRPTPFRPPRWSAHRTRPGPTARGPRRHAPPLSSASTRGGRVKTLFVSYRVTDLDRSLDFYTALGYVELGRVAVGDGSLLVILRFPDEPAASLELVHRPAGGIPGRPAGSENIVAHRPGRLPHRAGGMAARTSGRHHGRGLALNGRGQRL